MLYRIFGIFSAVLFQFSFLQAEPLSVNSRVSEVTLFPDRALVTRVGSVTLPVGVSVVRFLDVPDSLDKDTLKVNGKGTSPITIASVDYKSIPVPKPASPRYAELETQLEHLESEGRLIKLELERLNSQKKLVTQISLDAGIPQKGSDGFRPRTAQEMKEVLNFVNSSAEAIDAEIEKGQIKERENIRKLQTLRRELEGLGNRIDSKSVVEVTVESKSGSEASLTLTYQIVGASWRPTYNLLTTKGEKGSEFTLDTYGLMNQHTGEDWNDVDLILSTARPALGLNRPEPHPLDLQIFEPRPVGSRQKSMEMSGGATMRQQSAPAPMEALDAAMNEIAVEEVTEETAELSKYGSISMRLPRKITLKSDGSEAKVKVQSAELKGVSSEIAVPYLTSEVYEEAKLINGDAPLLPGEARVFVDGTYIGSKGIEFSPPGKEIYIPIGVSQSIGVVRKLIKKFEDDPGVVRSFRRVTVQYSIEVENYSSIDREVVLLERGIVSQNEKIKITPISFNPEPLIEADPVRISKKPGVWEWHLKVNSKEKKVISYEISVEVPAGVNVPGLDQL